MYKKEKNKDELCIICWLKNEPIDDLFYIKEFNEYIVSCQCNILMHFNCLEQWIQKTHSCPICRKNIVGNYLLLEDDFFKNFNKYVTATKYALAVLKLATTISFLHLIWILLLNTYFQYLFLFEIFQDVII
jgi:hypothetical protein